MSGRVGYSNVVTDGLVLYLDAGNRASYPGSGTTWGDLSAYKNNGILTNGPSYSTNVGGSIIFDGTDDYVPTPNFNIGSNDFTYETWTYCNSWQPNHFITIGGETTLFAAMRLCMNNNSGNPGIQILCSYDNSSWALTSSGTAVPITLGVFTNIVVSRVAGTIRIYTNSIEKYSTSLPGSLMSGSMTNIGKLAGDPGPSGFWFNGGTAISRLYINKGLSQTEISQNYNALKGRFGL